MQRFICVCFFCIDLFSFWTNANCYFPNGSDANALQHVDDFYQPCDSGDKFSMCCALNHTDADKCRSDGLCQSTADGYIWRDSCTDPYWLDHTCIKLCIGIKFELTKKVSAGF